MSRVRGPRCRCSHARSQHYRDRNDRPMCVGSCGCLGYRPQTPVGASGGELLAPTGTTPAVARAAALAVCRNAADRAEAMELLQMCGLIDDDTADANAAALDQAAHEQWARDNGYLRKATP